MQLFPTGENRMVTGFEPICDEHSKVLVLGSFPSVISRKVGFYYGNKRNRFWDLISEIFGDPAGEDAESKTAFLLRNGIALWDIVEKCEIRGSEDGSIRNESVVDLNVILSSAPISAIVCNGKKSYAELSAKYPSLPQKIYCLPSTSPANVSFDKEKWLAAFREIRNV